MNKKGQAGTGAVTFFITALIFIIIWAFWLGSFLSDWGQRAIATNGLTGLEAFFFANINLVIFLCLGIAGAGFLYTSHLGGEY